MSLFYNGHACHNPTSNTRWHRCDFGHFGNRKIWRIGWRSFGNYPLDYYTGSSRSLPHRWKGRIVIQYVDSTIGYDGQWIISQRLDYFTEVCFCQKKSIIIDHNSLIINMGIFRLYRSINRRL